MIKRNLLKGIIALTLVFVLTGCSSTPKDDASIPEIDEPEDTTEDADGTDPDATTPEVTPPVTTPDAKPKEDDTTAKPETKPESKPTPPVTKPETKPTPPATKPTPPVTKPETPKPVAKTNDDLAKLINSSSTLVQYNEPITDATSKMGAMIVESLGITAADMDTYAISISMINIKAYGIAVIKPAEGKEDIVKAGLEGFVANTQNNFEQYLQDQYEVAKAAQVVEYNGYYIMVMCGTEEEVDPENPADPSLAITAALDIIKAGLK